MSSAAIQAVANVQLYNYASFVITAAVWYDYILTFSREIEYIWCQPWSWVTSMFVISRYFGLCSVMLRALWWNSVINASSTVIARFLLSAKILTDLVIADVLGIQGNLMAMIGGWCFWIFFCCADLVMIFRLWALYARSKLVLGTLLVLYLVEVVSFFIDYVVTDTQFPGNPFATAIVVSGSLTCASARTILVYDDLQTIAQLALGAWMCVLVVIQFLKESIRMYKIANRVMLSDYQKLLVWEGVVYYSVVLLFAIICQLANTGQIPNDRRQVLYAALQQTFPFMLFPRFVLNLREVYARELEGRREGTQSQHGATGHSVLFAGLSRHTEGEDDIEMEMGVGMRLKSQRETASVDA